MKLFSTPPDWLRWVLLLPVSFALGLFTIGVLEHLVALLKDEYESTPVTYWVAMFAAAALAQYLVSWAAHQIAPRGKVLVHRLIAGVSIALFAILFAVEYRCGQRGPDGDLAKLYGASFGAAYAWITIRVGNRKLGDQGIHQG